MAVSFSFPCINMGRSSFRFFCCIFCLLSAQCLFFLGSVDIERQILLQPVLIHHQEFKTVCPEPFFDFLPRKTQPPGPVAVAELLLAVLFKIRKDKISALSY